MTSLQSFLNPRAVAVIGASGDVAKFGGRTLRNLVAHHFPGPIYPITRKGGMIMGLRAYAALREVPGPVDLAIVAVPQPHVLEAIEECGQHQVPAVIVQTSGYAEVGDKGAEDQAQLLGRARAHGIRLLGPNCLGLYHAGSRLAASGNSALGRSLTPGTLAVLSQSGALAGSIVDRAEDRGIHLRAFVTTGNEADLRVTDFLLALVEDEGTRVVAVFLEECRDVPALFRAAVAALEKGKALVVCKLGRSALGRAVARTHTGAMTGSEQAYDAFFKQYGVIRVYDIEQLLDVCALFTRWKSSSTDGIAMAAISGGMAGLLADGATDFNIELPKLSDTIRDELSAFIPSFATAANPLDVTGAVTSVPGLLERSLECLSRESAVGALVVGLTTVQEWDRLAQEVLRYKERSEKPIMVIWVTGSMNASGRQALIHGGIPVFETVNGGLRALQSFQGYHRFRRQWLAEASSELQLAPLPDVIREVLDRTDRLLLSEHESKQVLAAAGITVTREAVVSTLADAKKVARSLGFPVVLKVGTPGLAHKSEAGGVILGIRDARDLEIAWRDMMLRFPEAGSQEFLIQEMIRGGLECLVGVARDPQFGPLVAIGLGGVWTEILRETAFRVAPVTAREVRALVQETRVGTLLRGGRGFPPRDEDALVAALLRLSALALSHPRFEAIDVNPLMVLERGLGVVAVDALIELAPLSTPHE